jgi:hypothetical protein
VLLASCFLLLATGFWLLISKIVLDSQKQVASSQ